MLSKLNSANCLFSIRSLSKLATAYEAMDQRGDVANLTYLNNGFRVASYINNKPTATVGVWVDAGSRYEDNDNNGIAMVFENMVHSGSSKMNSMQLQNELAKMGVQLSSYTTREHSAFFAECLSADVEKVVNILADVLCDTNIHQAKVEEQSATAVNRLEKFEEENHQGVIMDNLHMTAYQGTSMALSPLGNTKALNSLTAESVKKYVDNNYKPNRMVLACAGGDVNHENLHKIAEKCFGNMDNNYSEKIPSNVSPTSSVGLSYIPQTGVRFTGSEFLYRDDSYPYIHGCVAVEGLPRGHTDCLALELLKTYVGQWNRTYGASLNAPSNIIQNCSFNPEIMGFQSFNISYDNTGLFGFYFILKGEDIDQGTQALRPMQRAWKHFAVSVRDEEVDKAKNALKTNMFAVLESNNKLADYVATEALSTGKITPLEQLERKIEYLSTDTIRDAIMHQIYDREIAAVGVGKTETFPIYHEMRYAMSWWRL